MTDLRAGVHPEFLRRLDIVLDRMAKSGHPMKQHQGLRTDAYQNGLYKQGRETAGPDVSPTRPLGRTVTNCDGYKVRSNHQAHSDGYGHAADCCFLGPKPFDPSHPWTQFGEFAKAQGLRWGGDFKFVDLCHVEMPDLPSPHHA